MRRCLIISKSKNPKWNIKPLWHIGSRETEKQRHKKIRLPKMWPRIKHFTYLFSATQEKDPQTHRVMSCSGGLAQTKVTWGVPIVAQQVKNPTGIHEDEGSIPGLIQWVTDAASCGVCHSCGSNPVLLWLWQWLEAAGLMRPLVWELPYAAGVAPEKKQTKQ